MNSKIKYFPKIIMLTILFVLMLGTIASARTITLLNKTFNKTDSEWLALKEPTLVEVDAGGNWYIMWAVDDPPKTNNIHYETTGYRIHTKPVSGSANKINNTNRTKLLNNFSIYGKEDNMGDYITINEGDQLGISSKQTINQKGYWFRLLKLTSSNIAHLFPGGYKSGNTLYFSGIMKNYLEKDVRGDIETYKEWVERGEHNLVFSNTTRGNIAVDNNLQANGGGTPNDAQLKNDILPKIGLSYIAAINNHYDRQITLNKILTKENRKVKVEVYINGELDTARTLTQVNLGDETNVKVNDTNKNIELYINDVKKVKAVSPLVEDYTIDTSISSTGSTIEYNDSGYTEYALNTNKKIDGKDITIRLYYKGTGKVTEENNDVYIYIVKEGTGSDYTNNENQLRDPAKIVGLPVGSTQKAQIEDSITYNKDSYSFLSAKTYYGNKTTPYNEKGICNPFYEYTVSEAKGEITNVVIEYKNTEPPQDTRKETPYTDSSLSSFAKGHILSNNYNVLKGIPTSEKLYSYAQANGFLYKIEGTKCTGTKTYNVVFYNIYQDENEEWKIDTQKGYTQNNYTYYTIDNYEIAALDQTYINNEILDGAGNTWTGNNLTVIPKIIPGKDYESHVTKTNTAKNMENCIVGTINLIKGTNDKVSDDTIYVLNPDITGKIVTQEWLNMQAKIAIESSLTEESDRIEIKNNVTGDSSNIIPYISPYLKYDLTLDYDSLQNAYQDGVELNWLQKIAKWIKDTAEAIAEKIKTAWDKLIAWLKGESGEIPTTEELVKEHNDGIDAINGLPRNVFKENFCKDNQQIEFEKLNGEYETTISQVKYKSISATKSMIEEEYLTQNMNGLTVLPNYSSYDYKDKPVIGGVYLADMVNNVFVHTPVAVNAAFVGNETNSQYLGSIISDENVVEMGKEYEITLNCTGMHRDILGYGNRNYSKYIKNNSIYMRFPYDIEVKFGDGDWKKCKAFEWYDIGTTNTVKVIIPEYSETEDNNGIVYYDLRASALNDHEDEELTEDNWLYNVNVDPSNPDNRYCTDMPRDYRAYCRIPVKSVGKIYDFRVNFTLDSEYLLSYTTGKLKDTTKAGYITINQKYKDDGLSIQNLPLGKDGTNESNVIYKKAIKLGNKFKFNLKTLGAKTNNIKITPTFYYINKVTDVSKKVDVYYQDKSTGKYVKLTDSSTYKIDTILPNTTSEVPNTKQKIAEPGPNIARINVTNQVKDAYANGRITQFVPTYLNRITSSEKRNIGNLGEITLNEQVRFRLPESTDVLKNASNSIWYGEYKLPSTSKFVESGKEFSEANIITKANGGDGYILVCFNIVGNYNTNLYLSYQKENGNSTTQWEKEGYNDSATLVNGKYVSNMPGSSNSHVGVVLYEAFENNGEDVVNPH